MGAVAKVVLDTNIFVSGFGWDGKPEEILRLLKDRRIVNYASAEIFEEIRRVVSYPKLGFSEPLQIRILEFVIFYSQFLEPQKRFFAVGEDPGDNKFIECAMEAKAEYIVSGDSHLLDIKRFKTAKIVTASEFLDIVSKK